MMLLGICLKVPSIRQLVMNMKLSTKRETEVETNKNICKYSFLYNK